MESFLYWNFITGYQTAKILVHATTAQLLCYLQTVESGSLCEPNEISAALELRQKKISVKWVPVSKSTGPEAES